MYRVESCMYTESPGDDTTIGAPAASPTLVDFHVEKYAEGATKLCASEPQIPLLTRRNCVNSQSTLVHNTRVYK